MGQPKSKLGLIRSRRTAIAALCFTAFEAALSIRDVLSNAPHKYWLPFDFLHPAWVVAVANSMFYAYLLWMCIGFYRIAQGKERVLVVGWFPCILLFHLEKFVSNSVVLAIQWIQMAGIIAAFAASVFILMRRDWGDSSAQS